MFSKRSELPEPEGQNASSDEFFQPRKAKTVTFQSPLNQSPQASPAATEGNYNPCSTSEDSRQFVKPQSVAPNNRSGRAQRVASFKILGQMAEQHLTGLQKFQEQILELELQYAQTIEIAGTSMDPTSVAVLEHILSMYPEEGQDENSTDENEQFVGLDARIDSD